jgi:hypothetical protein
MAVDCSTYTPAYTCLFYNTLCLTWKCMFNNSMCVQPLYMSVQKQFESVTQQSVLPLAGQICST